MANGTKSKFLVKHGLAVNTQSGTTSTLNYPTADGQNNQFIKTDGSGNLTFDSASGGGGVNNFLALSDTPVSYTGSPGRVLVVNDSGTGLVLSQTPLNNSQSRFAFTGDGATSSFTLGTNFGTSNNVLVYVDGVIQFPGTNFSIDSTVLTFTSNPVNNADILVFGTVTASGFPQGLIDSDALTNPIGIRGNMNLGGHIIPKVDSASDLGDSTHKFRDLYMSGSTIHLAGQTIKADTQGIVLPAYSRIGNRRFGGSRQDSAEKGFDSDLKGTYGSTSAIPVLTIDSAGFIDSVGTAAINISSIPNLSTNAISTIDSDLVLELDSQKAFLLNTRSTSANDGFIQTNNNNGSMGVIKGNRHRSASPASNDNNYFEYWTASKSDSLNVDAVWATLIGQARGGADASLKWAIADSAVNQPVDYLKLDGLDQQIEIYKKLRLENGVDIEFEGATDGPNETTLTAVDPTQDNIITLPDETGTVVTKQMYTGMGHDPSAQVIQLLATNNQGTAKLQIAAQGSTLIAPTPDVSLVYSNPVFPGFMIQSDLHLRAGNTMHVDATGGVEVNANLLLETGHTLSFEGSTGDSFETTLTVVDPTTDRTITFPDSTGTVALQTSLLPSLRVQGSNNRTLNFGDSCLTTTTSTATTNINDANVARFRKTTEPVGLDVIVYSDGTGYSSGVATNINETTGGGVSLQDNTYIGMMYWQDNRTGSKAHNFTSLDTNGSTYRTMLSLKGDSTMEATFGGKVKVPASGIEFSDGTSQTTAPSGGGVTTGKAIAMAMIFG